MTHRRFSADPDAGLPAAILHEDALVVGQVAALGTPRLLWARIGPAVHRVAVPGPWQVAAVRGGIAAWAPFADALLTADGLDLNLDPRVRRGRALTARRTPGGPWEVEGVSLPGGARWARDLRPWLEGGGLTWSDSGYAYRWDLDGAPVAVGAALPWPPEPSAKLRPPPPEAARGRAKVAGLRVSAHWRDGDRVHGWLADGVHLIDHASSGIS